MKKATTRKGDTLIEVTLAVGIFSMVAVAVLAVMNGSASSAQTALEATLTREEIDAQADALRFIHSAYVADKSIAQSGSGETKSVTQIMADSDYAKLWHEIISNPANADSLAAYPPSTCETAYSDTSLANAFILNTHLLGEINNGTTDNIVIRPTDGSNLFATASTYPRLVYADSASLLANSNTFQSAEGLYIIPVPEQVSAGATPSYYDFYIRSCWYGIGDRDTAPSTISTVMRLYNPDYVKPTVAKACDKNITNYIMVDTNMRVNGVLKQKGVEGINIEFKHTPKSGDQVISTSDHNKCLYTDIDNSPGAFNIGSNELGEPYGLKFSDRPGVQDENDCPYYPGTLKQLTRLKAKTGTGSEWEGGTDKHLTLDSANNYNGGDFWYPVHIGDKIEIVIKSNNHKLYYQDVSDEDIEASMNPFICDRPGVTCNICKKDEGHLDEPCGGERMDYQYENIKNIIQDVNNPQNRLEVTIDVSGCAANDTTSIFGDPPKPTISINTNWELK